MFGITRGIKCVFSGKFENEETIREVFKAALKEKSVDVGVLRICDEESGLDGDIGIERSVFVIGGRIRGRDEHGWEAIKLLLNRKKGTYQYLDLRNRFPHGLDCGLKVRLTDLITAWPNLPDSAEKLKCGRESLNRIRAYSDNKNPNPTTGRNQSGRNQNMQNQAGNNQAGNQNAGNQAANQNAGNQAANQNAGNQAANPNEKRSLLKALAGTIIPKKQAATAAKK